jgi:hypothetical protein
MVESGESGMVIGTAEFMFSEEQYQIRYCNGQACQIEAWFAESGLKKINV